MAEPTQATPDRSTAGPTKRIRVTRRQVELAQAKVEADRAQANQFIAAATWAEQHPPESIHDAATWLAGGYETPMVLAGPGAPLVAEFCIAEFALAIGRSTDSGRAEDQATGAGRSAGRGATSTPSSWRSGASRCNAVRSSPRPAPTSTTVSR